MKKNLFIAALLCGISFAGNAATPKAKSIVIEKKPMAVTKVCRQLYQETWTCPSGAYSIVCYGYTQAAAHSVYNYYCVNLDC